jgi:hypothetical protein
MNADVARPRTLRLSRGRLRLYSVGLALMGVGQIIWAWKFDFWDWKTFASAGAHVGSAELLHPQNVSISFVYLPAFAWAFAPFAHASHAVGFAANATAMLLCAGAAALIASRAYAVSVPLALALVFAWCPTMNALVIGQNSPAGLLLVMLSLLGARRNAALLTAVPIGLLLYKPTYALPLIGLLVLRSRWREVGIVALIGAAWYAASISAAGGDVTWPRAWLAVVHGWFGPDFAQNGGKAIGLSALLLRAGVPGALILAAAAAIVCSAIPMLRRAPVREAYAVACVLGLALSPHAWGYDAVLALPLIFLALDAVPEPPRTIVVCTAYATAPLMIYADAIGLSPLALPVVGGLAAWFIARGRSMRAARAAT